MSSRIALKSQAFISFVPPIKFSYVTPAGLDSRGAPLHTAPPRSLPSQHNVATPNYTFISNQRMTFPVDQTAAKRLMFTPNHTLL